MKAHRKNHCGRKKRPAEDFAAIVNVLYHQRGTLQALSAATEIPLATLHSAKKASGGSITARTLTKKASLSLDQRKQHVHFCLQHILPSGLFDPCFTDLHIDKKWFNHTRADTRVYMLPDEVPIQQTIQNKLHIPKIMFMCAVTRPHHDHHNNCD